MGVEVHLCEHLAGLATRGLCDRCVCQAHRGLACRWFDKEDFVLAALEQSLFERQPECSDALIHQSDRGLNTFPFLTQNA